MKLKLIAGLTVLLLMLSTFMSPANARDPKFQITHNHIERHGVYTVWSPYHASFISDRIPYGDVEDHKIVRVLGHTRVVVDWILAGKRHEKFRMAVHFYASHDLPLVQIRGHLSNGAPGVANGGKLIQNCHGPLNIHPYTPGMVVPDTHPFCVEGDSLNTDHNMAAQFSWNDPDRAWGDYWYVTVQSPVAHGDGIPFHKYYHFTSAYKLAGHNSPEARFQGHVVGGFNGVPTIIGA